MAILAQGCHPLLDFDKRSVCRWGYSRMGAQPDLSEALPSEGDSGEIILLGYSLLGSFLDWRLPGGGQVLRCLWEGS